MYSYIHSALDTIRDYAKPSTTSNFRETGKLTPDEFVLAGDFLTSKFTSWSWSAAATSAQRVSHLPENKQYLVTRGVECKRRLNDDKFAGREGLDDLVKEGETFDPTGDDDDGWLRTGGDLNKPESCPGDIRTVDDDGHVEQDSGDYEEDVPDIEDEDDDPEAIIRDPKAQDGQTDTRRYYTIYITYSTYYMTPRLYLSGYSSSNEPLPPLAMMEDIVGDYKDKTVTLEDFNFVSPPIKTASIHPCRHASVMKILLDRADAALKLRIQKMKNGQEVSSQGMEGLVDQTSGLRLDEDKKKSEEKKNDEWEVLTDEGKDDEVAIRIDQYLVVFLKFMASVTPGINHDNTMAL
ncbi:hypothetical protein M436DRAFT_73318 [Aureobasidium namibiae CBS 147.97]|uniref:Autophagy-related protein 3 n=1 Tax=Aureobasidium namibiae CBS 147.97 TaxID=1043004 RepID=A0A074WRL6_9PEZI